LSHPLPILLVPEKTDTERDQVIDTWNQLGGVVRRLGKYWIKDDTLQNTPIAIYGNQTFSLVLAQLYDVDLISPDDTLIAKLDMQWTKRNVGIIDLSAVTRLDFPVFIKPVIPKLFPAALFNSLAQFNEQTNGLDTNEQLIISEIVDIEAEARSYIMNGEIADIAIYEGNTDIIMAEQFLIDFLQANANRLPPALVIDLAFNKALGWFVLEFNACWGAGLNGCNSEKVIKCIIAATRATGQ
jgi:hypothetical protein